MLVVHQVILTIAMGVNTQLPNVVSLTQFAIRPGHRRQKNGDQLTIFNSNITQPIPLTHGVTIHTLQSLELALVAAVGFPTKHTTVDVWFVGNHI